MSHPFGFLVVAMCALAFALSVLGATLLELPSFDPDQDDIGPQLQAAYQAHEEGRYQEAYFTVQSVVQSGKPEAWYLLGWLQETGRGTRQDLAAALDSYAKAQEAGSVDGAFRRCALLLGGDEEQRVLAREILEELAKTNPGRVGLLLGEAYVRGALGDGPDYEAAVKWWTMAADEGEARGFINLAKLREGQFGFPEKTNPAAAIEYLMDAAKLDNKLAMAALGSRYLNGAEEIRDEEKGIQWLTRAAAHKVPEADLVLATYYANERKNHEKAREHYQGAVDGGNVAAHIELGVLYQNGTGGEQSTEKALDLFKRAAARGSAEGAHYVATLLLNSTDREKATENIVNGYRFLLAAAGQRTSAQVDIAMLYLSGRLGVADPVSAAAWFDRAARLGDPVAQNNLATLYESGTGVPRNLKAAFNLYGLASRQGHAASTTARGRFYASGAVVEKNPVEAWALFSLAAERGDPDGKGLLEELTASLTADQVAEGKKRLEQMKSPAAPKKAEPPVEETPPPPAK